MPPPVLVSLTFEPDAELEVIGDPGRTTAGLPSARGAGGGIAKESAVNDSARGEDEGKSFDLSRGELSRPTNEEKRLYHHLSELNQVYI